MAADLVEGEATLWLLLGQGLPTAPQQTTEQKGENRGEVGQCHPGDLVPPAHLCGPRDLGVGVVVSVLPHSLSQRRALPSLQSHEGIPILTLDFPQTLTSHMSIHWQILPVLPLNCL